MALKQTHFTKMHGIGNDYIVIDETKREIVPENRKYEISRQLCRRRFSIGADGLIFVSPSDEEDVRFRIFNSDGSEAEMCGNGIRCFSKYVYDANIVKKDSLSVETLGGAKKVSLNVGDGKVLSSKVDMGVATFKSAEIPVLSTTEEFVQENLDVDGENFVVSAVNVGNPHAVIFSKDLESVHLSEVGPLIESHDMFPQKINVHFIKLLNRNEIEMITWERGAGITLACGTGAVSCVISAYKLGLVDKDVLVHLPGGDLKIEVYKKDGQLGGFMEGDAVHVFDGTVDIQ